MCQITTLAHETRLTALRRGHQFPFHKVLETWLWIELNQLSSHRRLFNVQLSVEGLTFGSYRTQVSLSLFYSCRSICPKQASNRVQQEWNSRDLWTERNANQGKWTPYEESQQAYRASWTSREGRVRGACKKHQRGNRWGLPQRSLDFLKEDSGDPESFPYLMEDGSLTGEQGMGQEGVWPADISPTFKMFVSGKRQVSWCIGEAEGSDAMYANAYDYLSTYSFSSTYENSREGIYGKEEIDDVWEGRD